jgi:putative membrane protein
MMGHGFNGQGWGFSNGMGWGGWLMMSIFAVVCLAVLVAVVYWLLQAPRSDITAPPREGLPRPLTEATLDERFARGDINEDEYLRRKSLLESR